MRQYLTEYERDAIRPYVLGNFRDMLGATAHSPAMLFYLDNFQSRAERGPQLPPNARSAERSAAHAAAAAAAGSGSSKPSSSARRRLNENYARELMELHTLGVDGGYTQQDVDRGGAHPDRLDDRPPAAGRRVRLPPADGTTQGTKTVLGKTFAAGGEKEGERLLDMLALHPKTAHHIAYELAQRFVADEPPAALVDRAAKTFLDTKGDLRRGHARHHHVAGVLRPEVLLGQGQDAARVRRVRRARDQRHRRQRAADGAGAAAARHAALRRAAADRLQHDGGRVGQHGRARRPHELRPAARGLDGAAAGPPGAAAARGQPRSRCAADRSASAAALAAAAAAGGRGARSRPIASDASVRPR